MFKFTSLVKTIKRQGEKILRQYNQIKELEEENNAIYEEKRLLEKDKSDLIEKIDILLKELTELTTNKDLAEKRNVQYARLIKEILAEINVNQNGSVENLQNKIKTIIEEVLIVGGKH